MKLLIKYKFKKNCGPVYAFAAPSLTYEKQTASENRRMLFQIIS